MNNNVYGVDLGTSSFKIFCKASGKILKEKNTVAIINKDEIFGVGAIITGVCSDIGSGTCGSINHKGIRIVGW